MASGVEKEFNDDKGGEGESRCCFDLERGETQPMQDSSFRSASSSSSVTETVSAAMSNEKREEKERRRPSSLSSSSSESCESTAGHRTTTIMQQQQQQKQDPRTYESMMSSVMYNAGRWAYGVVAIEVWALDQNTQHLDRVPGGYWRCHAYPHSEALDKLEDSTRRDYHPPVPLLPGVGFVGSLWAESSFTSDYVAWRDLRAMVIDPDQPCIPRTNLLAEAFGLAAGMGFHQGDTRGVVVFFTRYTVDRSAISTPQNLHFMRSATNLIGAAVSFRNPRQEAMVHRSDLVQRAAKRIRAKVLTAKIFRQVGLERSLRNSQQNGQQPQDGRPGMGSYQQDNFRNQNRRGQGIRNLKRRASEAVLSIENQRVALKERLKKKLEMWLIKVKGGTSLPPPGMPLPEVAFSLVAILMFLLIVSGLNEWIHHSTGGDHAILLAPLGGLAVNLFCMPASPASQPRNALFGMLICLPIAIGFSHIPEHVLPMWLRVAVAPAMSITAMTYLGVIHPPAGAVAVVFALGNDDNVGETLGLLLFSWCFAILFSTLVNNLSQKRQYPNYWRWNWIPDCIYKYMHKRRAAKAAAAAAAAATATVTTTTMPPPASSSSSSVGGLPKKSMKLTQDDTTKKK